MARPRKIDGAGNDVENDPFGGSQGPAEEQAPSTPALNDIPIPEDGGFIGGAPFEGRSEETPRERESISQPQADIRLRESGGGSDATPGRSSSPKPMAGSSFSPPPVPFQPMQQDFSPSQMALPGGSTEQAGSPGYSPSIGSMATPRLRGLFGSMGGLQGGGLGLPLDPTNDAASDPIMNLIKQLKGY